ncbi:MAG: ComF family protein [Humibacter sp.]
MPLTLTRHTPARLVPARPLHATIPPALRSALLDAIAVLAPTSCSGCGAPDRSVCESCVAALEPEVRTVDLDGLAVAYAHEYDGVVRSALAAYKDGGRTDATARLAPSLSAAIDVALDAAVDGPVRLVTIPSSRAAFRERGYAPVDLLLRHCGLHAEHALRSRRQAADQAGLTAESRRLNRVGWLTARRWVAGEQVIIVDDILTTGSTLSEARRALEAGGATVLSAAVVARTRRRIGTDVGSTTPSGEPPGE